MITEISKNWWVFLVRGLVAIVCGVLAIQWPNQAWSAMVALFGSLMLLDGIFTLIASIDFSRYFDKWWVVALEGVVGIVIGIFTLTRLGDASEVLIYVIAAWAIITGILELVLAYRIRADVVGDWSMVISGLLSIILGILLIVYPDRGIVSMVWIIAIYAILFGIMQVIFSIRLKGLEKYSNTDEVSDKDAGQQKTSG